jgi:hypothetical protein
VESLGDSPIPIQTEQNRLFFFPSAIVCTMPKFAVRGVLASIAGIVMATVVSFLLFQKNYSQVHVEEIEFSLGIYF